jgi:hypothetical protein
MILVLSRVNQPDNHAQTYLQNISRLTPDMDCIANIAQALEDIPPAVIAMDLFTDRRGKRQRPLDLSNCPWLVRRVVILVLLIIMLSH